MKTLPCLAAALFTTLSLPLLAAESAPVNQFGQAHPAVPDMSANPNWHVYRFQRDGIEYLQVNALDDQPRLAVAVAHGTVLVLPIGRDADRVQVLTSGLQPVVNKTLICNCDNVRRINGASNQPQPLHTSSEAAPVYQDPSVQIQAVPGPSGDAWRVEATSTGSLQP